MGYDLKTGWILRGKGADPARESRAAKEQVKVEMLGGIIGILVVLMFANMYLSQDIMPPISYTPSPLPPLRPARTPACCGSCCCGPFPVRSSRSSSAPRWWASSFATGLLLNNPIYGIGVLLAVVVRLIFGTEFMEVRDSGLICRRRPVRLLQQSHPFYAHVTGFYDLGKEAVTMQTNSTRLTAQSVSWSPGRFHPGRRRRRFGGHRRADRQPGR